MHVAVHVGCTRVHDATSAAGSGHGPPGTRPGPHHARTPLLLLVRQNEMPGAAPTIGAAPEADQRVLRFDSRHSVATIWSMRSRSSGVADSGKYSAATATCRQPSSPSPSPSRCRTVRRDFPPGCTTLPACSTERSCTPAASAAPDPRPVPAPSGSADKHSHELDGLVINDHGLDLRFTTVEATSPTPRAGRVQAVSRAQRGRAFLRASLDAAEHGVTLKDPTGNLSAAASAHLLRPDPDPDPGLSCPDPVSAPDPVSVSDPVSASVPARCYFKSTICALKQK